MANAQTLDAATGAALGVLAGLMVGMTTSGVVASVVGSVVALATAFVGLGGEAGRLLKPAGALRLLAFCAGAALALLAGVAIRTHDGLGPSTRSVVQDLKSAGFSQEQALDLVRFRSFGLTPAGAEIAPAENQTVRAAASSLFRASADDCDSVRRDEARPADERLERMKRYGGTFQKAAERIARLPGERRDSAVAAARFYLCEE